MTDTAELASERFRLLVEQIREELKARRGWKREAARRLGCSDTMVQMVLDGDRPARMKAVSTAADRLGLDQRYFFDVGLGSTPRYADWIVRPDAAWEAFRRDYADRLTEEQFSEIQRFAARGGIQARLDYAALADMLIRNAPSPTFERDK